MSPVLRSRGSLLVMSMLVLIGGATVPGSPSGASSTERPVDVVDLLPLSTSSDRRIVDSEGRDVVLRGANVNSLGEYWQGVPSVDPTIPVTDEDWESMAAHGFSVVRLLITWSLVEPVRGDIDQTYLDRVDAAVAAAADHGMYTVIDMHQDAYTAFLSTSDPAECPAGTAPAKGWDGAPAWAVLSDGLSTCLEGGDRNSSPAVNRAWNNFYDDVDGIRTAFASMWGEVAARFAGRAEVAGYDLLNEPEAPRPSSELQPIYEEFLADVITSVREAEAGASFDHLIFVEPALPAGDPSLGLVIPDPAAAGVDTANVVGSVHNYSESIAIPGIALTIEGTNDLIETITDGLGVAAWGGEYGFWDTSADTLAKARRYAADEDAHAWGGAWWQWRQSCGDPHAVSWSGDAIVAATSEQTHLNRLGCPDNADLGPNDAFLSILGRGYPRATPGRITELVSDPVTGRLKVKASAADAGGELVVWTPTVGDAEHQVNVFGLTDVVEHQVAGGRLITAVVSDPGVYALWIGEPDEDLSPPVASPGPGAAVPATPVSGTSAYTG